MSADTWRVDRPPAVPGTSSRSSSPSSSSWSRVAFHPRQQGERSTHVRSRETCVFSTHRSLAHSCVPRCYVTVVTRVATAPPDGARDRHSVGNFDLSVDDASHALLELVLLLILRRFWHNTLSLDFLLLVNRIRGLARGNSNLVSRWRDERLDRRTRDSRDHFESRIERREMEIA